MANTIIMRRIIVLTLLLSVLLSSCKDPYLVLEPGPIEGNVSEVGNRKIPNSPNTLQHPDKFVWGASVVKGEDGNYHMLYSRWDTGPENTSFSNAWVLYSEIAYAVSKYPDRDFVHKAVILRGRVHEGDSTAWDAQAVHNPHIKRFNNKYYLYYIGNKDPGPVPEGRPGWKLGKRDRCQQNQLIGVIEFNSFTDLLKGNYVRPDKPLLIPRTRVKHDTENAYNPSPDSTEPLPDNLITVNPSVVYRKSDKKFLLYFKGNIYDPVWRGVHGVALSESPTGPFRALDNFIFDIRNEDGTIASAEDPFVWYHKGHNTFYAIIKDFTGLISGSDPGLAILSSGDGINWAKPAGGTTFLMKELIFKSGNIFKVSHLERPQLLTDNSGKPLVLYAACSFEPVGNKKDGSTFNVHIPLRQKTKRRSDEETK